MIIYHQRITIIRQRKPSQDLNQQLQWLGNSLGLFNIRDKDKSCFRIFVELLKSSSKDLALTSDELAALSNLSRGTVVHHLDRLMKSGLVIHEKNKYLLRVNNLESLVDEIQKDIQRTLSDLKQVAQDLDKELNL